MDTSAKVQEADLLEKQGENLAAARMFAGAFVSIGGRYEWGHRAAINYRLAGEYTLADGYFDALLKDPDMPDEMRCRVMRDKAMSYLARKRLNEAMALLDKASLRQATIGEHLEVLVTNGFVARVYATKGQTAKARRLYEVVHNGLHQGDNRVYELNNLIWWMKIMPFMQRRVYGPMAIELAEQTGYVRRRREILAIMWLGGWLYEKLKALR